MDFWEERDRILRGIPGATLREKLVVAMMTGAFDHLIAEQERREEQAVLQSRLLEVLGV